MRVRERRFSQVDVFAAEPQLGNPVAVVLEADGLDGEAMARFANWTNLSETTFVVPPTSAEADYAVRIFTPTVELPFAGHPTLGTCHAWLEAGGRPRSAETVVQECGAGLVSIRRDSGHLAFAAPALVRDGPVDESLVDELAGALNIDRGDVVDAQWADNGPGWVALLLGSAEQVLAVRPGYMEMDIGLVGPHLSGSPEAIEVRAFFPKDGVLMEDPVTGSLNASIAPWLLDSGRLVAPYVARQGTALGRAGQVHVSRDDDGTVWVGGPAVTCVSGTATL